MKTEIHLYREDTAQNYFFESSGRIYAYIDGKTYDIEGNKIVNDRIKHRIVEIEWISTNSEDKLVSPSQIKIGQVATIDNEYIIKISKKKFFYFFAHNKGMGISSFDKEDDCIKYRLLNSLSIKFT